MGEHVEFFIAWDGHVWRAGAIVDGQQFLSAALPSEAAARDEVAEMHRAADAHGSVGDFLRWHAVRSSVLVAHEAEALEDASFEMPAIARECHEFAAECWQRAVCAFLLWALADVGSSGVERSNVRAHARAAN